MYILVLLIYSSVFFWNRRAHLDEIFVDLDEQGSNDTSSETGENNVDDNTTTTSNNRVDPNPTRVGRYVTLHS
jgi:hypothetical protein